MRSSQLLGFVAAVVAGVEAQDSTSSTSRPSQTTSSATSTTSSAATTTHSISVGAEGFKFSPNEITNASVGDIIEYRFYPGGHSVVRSEFAYPCIPYERIGVNKVGFFSGPQSPQVISNDLPKFQIRVNNTDPIFFYCNAPGSCIKEHMIGVINPNSTHTLQKQFDYALNATLQLGPNDPFPSESFNPTSATPKPTSDPSNNGGNNNNTPSDNHALSAGAIAGIAIGGAAVLVLTGALIYLCGRRGGLDRAYRRSTSTYPPPMMDAKFGPKSPGQETFSTAHHYMGQGSPPPHQQHFAQSPGMLSPGSHPQHYPSVSSQPHSPPLGGPEGHHNYFVGQPTPPPDQTRQQVAPPVELPTSGDPGHSPLPGYTSGRQFSWSQGTEGQYRPGDKP